MSFYPRYQWFFIAIVVLTSYFAGLSTSFAHGLVAKTETATVQPVSYEKPLKPEAKAVEKPVQPVLEHQSKHNSASTTVTPVDNRPLEEVYSHQESLIDWGDLIKMYTVFGVLLVVLVGVLIWVKKSGLADKLKQHNIPHHQPSFAKIPAFKMPQPDMAAATDSVLKTQFEQEQPQYKPLVAYKETLGPGKDLVTVFIAGQWYLIGVTGNNIQLIANLTHPVQPAMISPEAELVQTGLDATVKENPSFSQIYEKYIATNSNPSNNNISEIVNNKPMDMTSYQVDDLQEFDLPDFEDVFEQA